MLSWDTRDSKSPNHRLEAHDREILSVAFSPASEHLLITGSADKVRVFKNVDCVSHGIECA